MVDAVAPAEETTILSFTRDIKAPIDQVWSAFTNRDDACDWLSYDAMIRAEEGGYALFTHYTGWHIFGQIKEIVENEKFIMTYQDGSDIGITKLKVKFEDKGDSVGLSLYHKGLPADKAEEYETLWNERLDNLQGVLETGAPPSQTNRVYIGIRPAPFDAERAKELNAPNIEHATFVNDTIEGYGAHKAGLKRDDLIVGVNGGEFSEDVNFPQLLEGKVPGDVVPVTFYRDGKKQTLEMELGGIPMPPVPDNFEDMAQYYENIYADLDADLTPILKDADEAKAEVKPADDQWSAKEILAHLILQQRHNVEWTSNYIEGTRRINPYQRSQGRIDALLRVYPTVSDLHEELRRKWKESAAMLRSIPKEREARKNYLWWIVFENALSGYSPVLFRQYFDTIKDRLNA